MAGSRSNAPPKGTKPTTVIKKTEWDGFSKFKKTYKKRRQALRKAPNKGLAAWLAGEIPKVTAEKAKPPVPMTKAGKGALAGKDAGVQGIANAANQVLERRFVV